MGMGKGYWLNPNTEQSWMVDRHERWPLDQKNAQEAAIPQAVFDYIKTLNPDTDMDEIRIAVMQAGLIRIRDYNRDISVQFAADKNYVHNILWSIFSFLNRIVQYKDTPINIDNFTTKDSIRISLRELGEKLNTDSTIMGESVIKDIVDVPLMEISDKLKKIFKL